MTEKTRTVSHIMRDPQKAPNRLQDGWSSSLSHSFTTDYRDLFISYQTDGWLAVGIDEVPDGAAVTKASIAWDDVFQQTDSDGLTFSDEMVSELQTITNDRGESRTPVDLDRFGEDRSAKMRGCTPDELAILEDHTTVRAAIALLAVRDYADEEYVETGGFEAVAHRFGFAEIAEYRASTRRIDQLNIEQQQTRLANAHSDGKHEDNASEYCPRCAEDDNADVVETRPRHADRYREY